MEFELWIRIIKESIDKRNIEPWNINIAEITDEYIKTIKELKKFDIRLSADVILVGGILLRMKSQILYGECENTFNEDEEFEEEVPENYDEYDEYEENYDNDVIVNTVKENKNKGDTTTKNTKSKQITFNDLINTLKSELKKVKKTKTRPKNKRETPIYSIIEEMEEEYDISDLMENLMSELKKEGELIYQNKFSNRKDIVKNFLPSLYLANDGKIEIFQEDIFKDIVLRCKN